MKNEYFQTDVIDLRIRGEIGSVCIYRFPTQIQDGDRGGTRMRGNVSSFSVSIFYCGYGG